MNLKEKCDPKHTALLVIDIQEDFAGPSGFRGKRGKDLSHIDPMVDAVEHLIAAASESGVLTLYTQQIYDRSKLNSLQKEQYDLDNKLVTCDPATGGEAFYRIDPPAGDTYEKQSFNAFSNPELLKRLEQNGIKTLVITGMDTCYCVETAVRNGYDLGYKIVVPKDCVAGSSSHLEAHDRTLWLVDKTFGVVSNSEKLGNIWKTS